MDTIVKTNKKSLQRQNPINKISYRLILFLVVFIPFEDFILKFLPVSDRIYFFARFLSECVVYAVFAIVILQKLIKGIPLSRTPLDSPLIILAEVVLLSVVVNNAGIFESIVSIRPILRYIILFYLIVNINITFAQAKTIIRYCIYAGVVQVAIGIVQFLSRGALNTFLQPRASDVEIGGATKDFVVISGREIGSIYGAAGDTILLATYLILFLIFVANKIYVDNNKYKYIKYEYDTTYSEKLSLKTKNIILLTIAFLTMATISLTYVRACLFIASIVSVSYLLLKYYSKKRIGIVVIIISLLIPIFAINISFSEQLYKADYSDNARQEEQSLAENITGIFSEDYLKVARKQRLGALTGIPLTVIANRPFLGYGPDELLAIENLNKSPVSFLTKVWTKKGFKDVYWVAIMAFYGVSGLATVIWAFYRLYKWSKRIYFRTNAIVTKEISLLVIAITLTTIVLMFFYRMIEFRIYGIYFWLFPALMFNLYSQEKSSPSKLK